MEKGGQKHGDLSDSEIVSDTNGFGHGDKIQTKTRCFTR